MLIPLFVTFAVLRLVFGYLDDFVRPWVRGRIHILGFPGLGVVSILVSLYVIGSLVYHGGRRTPANWDPPVSRLLKSGECRGAKPRRLP